MRQILFLSLIILLGVLESCSKAPKQSDTESYSILKFDELGKFKIAQFTDIHWDENAKSNDSTIAIIKHVLKEEQPNLVILSGDIVKQLLQAFLPKCVFYKNPGHPNGPHDGTQRRVPPTSGHDFAVS